MKVSAPRAARAAGAGAAGLLLAACTPALDWREVRPSGTGLAVLMPCRPVAQERSLALAGSPVRVSLQACSADGSTWGVIHADLVDPARIGPGLSELRRAAAANIAGGPAETLPLHVPGATPRPESEHLRLLGRLPGGRPVRMQLAVFARGTRVFQVTVVGEGHAEEAAQTFFGSIRLLP